MIQIGDKSFETKRPDDLDKQLAAATGCSVAEVQQQLRGSPLAQHVARALRPFLAEPPSMAELVQAIAAAGPAEVSGQVAELLDPPASAGAEPAHEA